jgi:putative Holliday junction resolvase
MKRVLGIDYGERRVGLAVSDEMRLIAQGLDTFDRRSGELLRHVSDLVERYDVGVVVLGHPLSMSGRDNVTSRNVEDFADVLRERLGVDVALWDERLSSEEARRVLKGRGAGKEAVDRVAAILILQSYLDSRAGTTGEPGGEGN